MDVGAVCVGADVAADQEWGEHGALFLISANTSTQVSLTTGGYSLVTTTPTVGTQLQVAVGDKFEIVAANTLGSVFGAGSVALQTGASASVADNVLAYSPSTNGWITYFHDGTSWRDAAVSGNQNNVVIAPDAALFVLRRATTAVDLYFSGTVPSTNEVADWAGSSGRFSGTGFLWTRRLAHLAPIRLRTGRAGSVLDPLTTSLCGTGRRGVAFITTARIGDERGV